MLVLAAQPGSVYSPSLFSPGNTTEQAAQSRDLEAAPQIVGTSSQPQILGVISSERSGYGAGLGMGRGSQGEGNGCGIAMRMEGVCVSQGSASSVGSIESVAPTPATIGRDQNKNGERQNSRQTPGTLETTSSQAEYERNNTTALRAFLALITATPIGGGAFFAAMDGLPGEDIVARALSSAGIALAAGMPFVAFCCHGNVASRVTAFLAQLLNRADGLTYYLCPLNPAGQQPHSNQL